MTPCYTCNVLRKKRCPVDFNLDGVCSECFKYDISCFQRRPGWVKSAKERRRLSAKIRREVVQHTRRRANNPSMHRGGARAPSYPTSAHQEEKQGMNVDGFFLGTPNVSAPLPQKGASPYTHSPGGSEFTVSTEFQSPNNALAAVPYYDMLANGDLPPIFAFLSHYLSTNYPGVRRVILEVDDMPRAGSDDTSLHTSSS